MPVISRWPNPISPNRSWCIRTGFTGFFSTTGLGTWAPALFFLHILPIRNIITRHNLKYQIYADDIQLYASCLPLQADIDNLVVRLEACLVEIREWMRLNYLKLNDSKTEFIVFGSIQQRTKVVVPHLTAGEVELPPADQVRNLGLMLDTGMTMQPQITSRVKSALFHLCNIRRIRKFLDPQATKNLVHAFITSGLDMFNFTLTGLPQQQVQRVQKMQNSAARLVTRTPPFGTYHTIFAEPSLATHQAEGRV